MEGLFTIISCFLLAYLIGLILKLMDKRKVSNLNLLKNGMSVENVKKLFGKPSNYTNGCMKEYTYRLNKTFSHINLFINFDDNWCVSDFYFTEHSGF